jgi:hypothetical protein
MTDTSHGPWVPLDRTIIYPAHPQRTGPAESKRIVAAFPYLKIHVFIRHGNDGGEEVAVLRPQREAASFADPFQAATYRVLPLAMWAGVALPHSDAQLRVGQRGAITKIRFNRSHEHPRSHRHEIYAAKRDAHPCFDDHALVEDTIKDVHETPPSGLTFNVHAASVRSLAPPGGWRHCMSARVRADRAFIDGLGRPDLERSTAASIRFAATRTGRGLAVAVEA